MLDFSDRTRTGISILTSAADYLVGFAHLPPHLFHMNFNTEKKRPPFFLGLSRLPDFTASDPDFRFALYDYLYKASNLIEMGEIDSMSVSHVLGLLLKGNIEIRKDQRKVMQATLDAYQDSVHKLELGSAIYVSLSIKESR